MNCRKWLQLSARANFFTVFLVFNWSTLNMLLPIFWCMIGPITKNLGGTACYVCVPTGRVQFAASTEVRDLLSRFPECVLLGGIAARVETQKALSSSSLSMKKRTNSQFMTTFLWRGYAKFDSLGFGFILWTNWIWCSNLILPSSDKWFVALQDPGPGESPATNLFQEFSTDV